MPRQIKAPPSHDAAIIGASGLVTREWYSWFVDTYNALLNRLPITGTATFSAATTVAVTFATPEPSADYRVYLSGDANRTYWASSEATTGFTINASASNSDSVGWAIIRA
jgi:hypothetical protein